MIHIIQFGSTKTPLFSKILNELDLEHQIIPHDDYSPEIITKASGLILSGAPVLVTEIDYSDYLEKYRFLINPPIPVLGVCFGHQLIGLVHGASCHKTEADRDFRIIHQKAPSILFKDIEQDTAFRQDHCEGVTVPKGFTLTADSAICKNEAMEHEALKLYGVQFHPEASGEVGQQLIYNFTALI